MVYLFGSKDRLLRELLISIQIRDFVPYSDGVTRKLHRIPRSITAKRIKGDASLTTGEKFILEGLSVINLLDKVSVEKRFLFIKNGRVLNDRISKPYFSLKRLLRMDSTDTNHSEVLPLSVVDGSPLKKICIEVPRNIRFNSEWLYADEWCTDEIQRSEFSCNWRRALSIEFIYDAVSCFPSVDPSSNINLFCVSHQLEMAIYDKYYDHGTSSPQLYWEVIHKIAACLSGKHRPGSIIPLILLGYYPSADSFVSIPYKLAYKSFIHEDVLNLY